MVKKLSKSFEELKAEYKLAKDVEFSNHYGNMHLQTREQRLEDLANEFGLLEVLKPFFDSVPSTYDSFEQAVGNAFEPYLDGEKYQMALPRRVVANLSEKTRICDSFFNAYGILGHRNKPSTRGAMKQISGEERHYPHPARSYQDASDFVRINRAKLGRQIYTEVLKGEK